MLSFLAKHPPRTRVAHLDQITYDDGQSTVTFKSPSDRYLVINQLPPNPAGVSRSSVLAPPVHWHAQQDETFHVLQGAAEFDMDGQTTTIGEGQIVSVPRGCFHRFCNASDERPLLIEFVLEPKMRDRDETYFSEPSLISYARLTSQGIYKRIEMTAAKLGFPVACFKLSVS
jgi:mannose-6-phosphate isomerase-like protein (cupin superfamily)